ncbi:UNVERIFIED_ORG: hypothetical protein FNL38_105309 [Nocardia globerula]|uniref:Uncharacterized protein n=2 Tax=Nocardiaceae TaxID=85025 RepID=A0A652YNJ7_NOCGL|nr:hypothetical protein C8E04_2852 [Rhodococcus globerulus]
MYSSSARQICVQKDSKPTALELPVGAPVTDRGLPRDTPGMTRARVLTVVATVVLALFLGGGFAAASPGGPDPYWWMGPQVRPWLESIFVGLANWFFNLPLVPYLS